MHMSFTFFARSKVLNAKVVVTPDELSTLERTGRADAKLAGKLLREYFRNGGAWLAVEGDLRQRALELEAQFKAVLCGPRSRLGERCAARSRPAVHTVALP